MRARRGRIRKRDWFHAPLNKIAGGNGLPCRGRAVGRAIQHQEFLDTDKRAVAIGFAVIKTGRAGDNGRFGSERFSGGQIRQTKKVESPKPGADHFDHPER